MITMMVWLLISTSDGVNNRGNTTVVERFKTKEMCEHVMKNSPLLNTNQKMKCIQAEIIK